MSSPLNFQLAQYEGPLDLLLDLIRKHKVNIYDIPIASITAQYMEFMEHAAAMDMELGSEFVYMAATLIHIKSKMLLPKDPALEEIAPEEDPRQELVDRLLEHEKYKDAAEMLQQKRVLEEAMWSNPQIRRFLEDEPEHSPSLDVSLFDLVKTFQAVLDRAKSRPSLELDQEDVTVPDMIKVLRDALEKAPHGKAISAMALFERQRSRRAMLCLFLAILEMVKRQAIVLDQADAFGDIAIRRSENFDENLAADQLAAVEKEYS